MSLIKEWMINNDTYDEGGTTQAEIELWEAEKEYFKEHLGKKEKEEQYE